ncbi:MAG: hypothetical protein KGH58_04490 [Candidatus Micrarchaeota archaeon]|nr:hypothetical protein [Candidatus Micrarchaeota archaeon]
MEITTELCEIVGAVIGDGNLWTDGRRYRVEMTGHPELDRDYFVYLDNLLFKQFGKRPYKARVRDRALYMRLQQKSAFELLTGLGIHAGRGKALAVEIPAAIREKGWEYAKHTLRGIMDTDGTVFFSKKTYKTKVYPTLEITTCSKKLAHQIAELLIQQNFRAKLRVHTRAGFNPEFKVALYGHRMISRWLNEIGFSNRKHINKLVATNSIQPNTPQ